MPESPTLSPSADASADHWHLDKRVPLALIFTIFLQTATVVWWASDINGRLNSLERSQQLVDGDRERLVRVEEKLRSTNDLLLSIDKRLERMEERRR